MRVYNRSRKNKNREISKNPLTKWVFSGILYMNKKTIGGLSVKNKEIKAVYDSFIKDGTETAEELEDSFLPSVKNKDAKRKLLGKMKEIWLEKIQNQLLDEFTISFYDLEIEFLKSLPDEKIKRLFYSLLCFEKLHWHESGWIRFEIDDLAEIGGLKTLKCEDFADLVPFGLKMRVTGSKNAVSTYYSIGWTIEKQTGKHREKKVVDVLGIECAEKFWEVVNGTC